MSKQRLKDVVFPVLIKIIHLHVLFLLEYQSTYGL